LIIIVKLGLKRIGVKRGISDLRLNEPQKFYLVK